MVKLSLISALKRNDRVTITLEVLKALGYEDRAEELSDSVRATSAFFDKAFAGIKEDDEPVTTEEVEVVEEDATEEIAEEMGEVELIYHDIEKLIEKGKAKKALKLIKAAKEEGHGGSVLEDLKKKAKSIKKDK